jgi:uncharacterized membrane protein YcaP (DUF421 family)
MQSFEIHLNDWYRIVFGNVPLSFLLEVVFRVVFLFLLILFCMRLMGKRMAAQLDNNETVALAALAASVGIPIQTPDRGLVPALIVGMVVVAGQRLVASKGLSSERFERNTQGDVCVLVTDGCLNLDNMLQTRISHERLFAQLRSMNIAHLGQVSRVYLEISGSFSVVENPSPQPGLSVLPDKDPEFRSRQPYRNDLLVCKQCGTVAHNNAQQCHNCGNEQFAHPAGA